MNNFFQARFDWVFLIITLLIVSCSRPSPSGDHEVIIWELDEPQGLNPITAKDATSLYLVPYLFEKMLSLDFDTYELVPVLASERPIIEVDQATNGMRLTYNIRPEAKWPNGTDINASDIIFSYKTIICPGVNTPLTTYMENVDSIIAHPDDPKSLIVYCKEKSIRAEFSTGYEPWIIPSYHYDPTGRLANYSFHQLKTDTTVASDTTLRAFAQHFNAIATGREPDQIVGSGPYQVQTWTTNQDVIFTKHDNWWGNEIESGENEHLEAYPRQLTIKIITDQTAAVTALKAGEIDVMRALSAKTLSEDLMQNERVKSEFNLITTPSFSYSVFTLNTQSPYLQDVDVRQALAYLVNYDRIINDILYGYANRIVGPVPLTFEKLYNKQLEPYQYDIEKARELLAQNGWVDTDRDGVLEKEIDGEEKEFRIQFMVNSGSPERENVALIFQESLDQAGIKMEINKVEWGNYLDRAVAHDFDLMYLVLTGEPAPEDYGQLWHTRSAQGGMNFSSFGTAETDQLIERMNNTLDEDKRAEMVKEFQGILHEEVPYIFLWSPQNRLAISKRFTNTHTSALRPGYWAPAFQLSD